MIKTKTNVGLVVLALFVVGVIGIMVFSGTGGTSSSTAVPPSSLPSSETTNNSRPVLATSSQTQTPAVAVPDGVTSYSLTDVSSHNSAQSCYTAISGKVYDLTAWIAKHPGGGRAILSICGIDGTNAYLGQHGSQRRPAQELAQFLIGNLK